MRPLVLDPLFRSCRTLSGVGTAVAQKLAQLVGGERVCDLLFHLPIEVVDRRLSPNLVEAQAGHIVTILVKVERLSLPKKRGIPARIHCRQGLIGLDLVYFNHAGGWFEKTFPLGQEIAVSGKLERYQDTWQMVHPDHVVAPEKLSTIQKLEPIYPLTAGIGNKLLSARMGQALTFLPTLPEWHDPALLAQHKWPTWVDALKQIHTPLKAADIDPKGPLRARLAYDEILARQLALLLVRAKEKRQRGHSIVPKPEYRSAFLQQLPFTLTKGQQQALADIDADMADPTRMIRLVQGDVGSGKTVIAFAALLNAVGTGRQAAIMAPTELLARQHFETMAPWAEKMGVSIGLVTGKNKEAEATRAKVASGAISIAVGTHALFQDSVSFKDLALVVIDEQHKFGVEQRLRLTTKGNAPDLLVMTATPIPRTLTLALYGDMDVTLVKDKPPGRKPVETALVSEERMAAVIEGLRRALAEGRQAYWVCPLVSETENLDLAAVEQRGADLQQHFGADVAVVHGKLKQAEKEKIIRAFAEGTIKVLVATTVIEVGINVPNATIMVIEHAERFGLAQLHQLRGRVGRGAEKSSCVLLYHYPLSEMAKQRLNVMRESEDGFVIAERDLQLRGAGEMLGTAQSGLPRFKLADAETHSGLIDTAHRDAQVFLARDPQFTSDRGKALKTLLYLFEQDVAFQTLQSG